MFKNEFRCLTNTVEQACVNCGVAAMWDIPPLVRAIVEKHSIALSEITEVALHQCPRDGGLVEYTLELVTRYRGAWSEDFEQVYEQAPGDDPVAHDTYVLYDPERDGLAKHLHLLH